MNGTLLGLAGLAVVTATGFVWFQRMREVRIPRDRSRFLAAMGVGVVLGIEALWVGTGTLGSIAAWLAVALGGTFLALRLISAQRATEPAVQIGSAILDFSAPDDSGSLFELGSLRGSPVLLKFFRGHW